MHIFQPFLCVKAHNYSDSIISVFNPCNFSLQSANIHDYYNNKDVIVISYQSNYDSSMSDYHQQGAFSMATYWI